LPNKRGPWRRGGLGGCLTKVAIVYKKSGDIEHALIKFKEALTLCKVNAGEYNVTCCAARYNVGKCYQALTLYSDAIGYFLRALQSDDGLFGPLLNESLGDCHMALEQEKKACSYYENVKCTKGAWKGVSKEIISFKARRCISRRERAVSEEDVSMV